MAVDWQALAVDVRPAHRPRPELAGDVLGPLTRIPRHPAALARFGLSAVRPASGVARRWQTPESSPLRRYRRPRLPAADPAGHPVGWMMFVAMGHRYGWPVAEGGSRSITDALASVVTVAGALHPEWIGRCAPSTTCRCTGLAIFDVGPPAFARIAGEHQPLRVRRAYQRFRYGPCVKVDLAVQGGVPWVNEHVGRAGTVHLGGTFEEVAAAESAIHRGQMPVRPFVLVAQQYLADPGRSVS